MDDDNSKNTKPDGWVHTHTKRAIYDEIKSRARTMRKEPTHAEEVLWGKLRRKQVNGYRFRRQHPIDHFIVDFYCAEARLVIEVDGSIHDEPEQIDYDMQRQTHLENKGLRILRITNAQVIQETDAVIEHIAEFLPPSKSPPKH